MLVDRGTCDFTVKKNVGDACAVAGIIGLITPGDPFESAFTDPGGPITIPGYIVSFADANAMRFGSRGVIDPDNIIPMPEPTTLALFSLGLAGFGFSRRRKV